MSTPEERLSAIYDAYKKAYDRQEDDVKAANGPAQANAIEDNVNRLEVSFLKASTAALDANGDAVESAYDAAVRAQEKVDAAYQDAKALAEKIRLVGKVAGKVGDLLTKAIGEEPAETEEDATG